MKTISLTELNELAALQTRVDRKYMVPGTEVGVLLGALDTEARVLEIDGRQDFDYESVYFDTRELASYRGAALKRRRRFKIRTRRYLDTGACYLEVKTEGARSTTVKDRIALDLKANGELGAEGLDYAQSVLADAGIAADLSTLHPVLTTSYRRRTLFIPSSASRATIDRKLTWDERQGERISLPRLAIIETKSGASASIVDRLLWSAGHRPSSISKYATGMAAFHPELPANKWAPILKDHFMDVRRAS